MQLETVKIGVIGGSGLYNMDEITNKVEYDLDTPFGKPSAPIVVGTLRGKRVAFLPRHGRGHVFTPSTVPYKANIYALKMLGVRFIIAVSACGSLKEEYAPGHLVIPDQLYDNTKLERGRTFFDTGFVGHVGVADPFDAYLSDLLYNSLQKVGGTAHKGGLFITIEGPRFSTRGESNIFRNWGCDIIGMTTSPEAFLAAEAEIAYAVIAHITDYDVWHETEEAVSVEAVMRIAAQNVATAQEGLAEAVEAIDEDMVCAVHSALQNAVMTHPDVMSSNVRNNLEAILNRNDNA